MVQFLKVNGATANLSHKEKSYMLTERHTKDNGQIANEQEKEHLSLLHQPTKEIGKMDLNTAWV